MLVASGAFAALQWQQEKSANDIKKIKQLPYQSPFAEAF
jgi:hypothetical protein